MLLKSKAANKHKENLLETISLTAGALQEGEQTRELLCPSCFGGSSSERSFAIRITEGRVHYRCFRASCGFGGKFDKSIGLLEDNPKILPAQVKTYSRMFNESIIPVGNIGAALFESKFGLDLMDLDDCEVRYAPDSDRYAFVVHSPLWKPRGWSIRCFNETDISAGVWHKWSAYPISDDICWMGWYTRAGIEQDKPVVLVEDAISAIKVSRQFICGYLNGTSLDYDKLAEVIHVGRKRGVVIALDKDATAKAIDLLSRWGFYLGANAITRALEKDLKYSTNQEIRQIILAGE